MSLWKLFYHLQDTDDRMESSATGRGGSHSGRRSSRLRLEVLEDRLPPGGIGLEEVLTLGDGPTFEWEMMGGMPEEDPATSSPMITLLGDEEPASPTLMDDDSVLTPDAPTSDLSPSDPDPAILQVEDSSDEEAELFHTSLITMPEDAWVDPLLDPYADPTFPESPPVPPEDAGGDPGGTGGSGASGLQVSITGISDDRGVSGTDYLTNDPTLTVVGTGTPGANLFVNGISSQVDAQGNWSVAIPELYEGAHSISAEVFAPGDTAAAFAAVDVEIDLTPPEVSLQVPTYTLNAAPTVAVQAFDVDPETIQRTAFVDVDLNRDGQFAGATEVGHSQGTLNEQGSGTVILNQLAPGQYRIRARVMDNAGNEGVSNARAIEISDDPYARQGLQFEKNVGQTDEQAKFLSRGSDYTLFVTESGATLNVVRELPTDEINQILSQSWNGGDVQMDPDAGTHTVHDYVSLRFTGAFPNPEQIVGMDLLPGKSNYFIGDDEANYFTGIDNYSQVYARNVYDGIDVIYQGNVGDLRYDLLVNPGADVSRIGILFEGAEDVALSENGDLQIKLRTGTITQTAPVLYQETVTGDRETVTGRYVLKESEVRLEVDSYDRSRALIIDPTFVYSTLLGGSQNELGRSLDIDPQGNAYLTGRTASTNFPTGAGAFDVTANGALDVFVTKYNPAGGVVYSTYVGGAGNDAAFDISVGNGVAYVGGRTGSANFPIPTTAGTSDNTFGGGDDGFLFALAPNGAELIYSTFVGGAQLDAVLGVEVDPGGIAFTTGQTGSAGFAPAAGAADTTFAGTREAFVVAYDTNLEGSNNPVYFTYLGGDGDEAGRDIKLLNGEPYVVGDTTSTDFDTTNGFQTTLEGPRDVFVTRLNSTGTQIVYSTYLGGSQIDNGQGIAVDSMGNAYVTGETESSTNFDTRSAFQAGFGGGLGDSYVSKFNTNLSGDSSLVYSSYLGGIFEDQGFGISLDSDNNAYVTGRAVSPDFPILDATPIASANGDVFLSVVGPDGDELLFSTVFGGTLGDEGRGVEVSSTGDVYVGGYTRSPDFPRINANQPTLGGGIDAFVARIPVNAIRNNQNQVLVDDRFEANDSSDQATLLGPLGAELIFEDLTITAKSTGFDFDWYRVTAAAGGTMSVLMEEGFGSDLELHLYALQGTSMVKIGSSFGAGSSHSVVTGVTGGQDYFVHVKGVNVAPGQMSTGSYTLTMSVS